jgi:hypothetical protein
MGHPQEAGALCRALSIAEARPRNRQSGPWRDPGELCDFLRQSGERAQAKAEAQDRALLRGYIRDDGIDATVDVSAYRQAGR